MKLYLLSLILHNDQNSDENNLIIKFALDLFNVCINNNYSLWL
jgi:hypothetical protein